MKRSAFRPLLLGISVIGCLAFAGQAADAPPPSADDLVRQMGQRLAAAQTFTFSAHTIRQQFLTNGQKVDIARNQKVVVRRPDRLAADVVADEGDTAFTFDGSTVTLLNLHDNVYGQASIKGNLDMLFDTLATKYGMTLPLVDLVLADPAKAMLSRVQSSADLGLGWVFDTRCRHLAFRQGDIDWEIWIQAGADPLPRKLVITYKDVPGVPQYIAYLSDWNLKADVPDARFTFKPPAGVKEIEFAAPAKSQPQPVSESK